MFHERYFNHYDNYFLRILALGLELPEDSLVKRHNFDATGQSSGDYILIPTSALTNPWFICSPIHEIVSAGNALKATGKLRLDCADIVTVILALTRRKQERIMFGSKGTLVCV